jgi:restriction system protein
LDWWRQLDGLAFEREVTLLFRNLGYDAKRTSYSGDGGVDIILLGDGRRILVQCKAHRNNISPGVVRELYGTMMHEGATEGWVVTTSGFYAGAFAFAEGKPIRLITIAELLDNAQGNGVTHAIPEGPVQPRPRPPARY